MLLSNGRTQEDIDEAVELKEIVEEAVTSAHPYINFEMVLLWWLSVEPAES